MLIFNIDTNEENTLESTETTTEFCLGFSKMLSRYENEKMSTLFERFELSESEIEDFEFQSNKFIVTDASWGGGTSDYTFVFGKTFKSGDLAQEWIHSKLYQVGLDPKEIEILVLDKEKMLEAIALENEKDKAVKENKEIANKKIEKFKEELIKQHPLLKIEIENIRLL